jgi:carbonic anhydrase
VRLIGLAVLLLASAATIYAGFHKQPTPEPVLDTPKKVLADLKAGNGRFQKLRRAKFAHYHVDPHFRAELADGEKPIALVLTCTDNRVDPALIFDQELRRLLVIRDEGRFAGIMTFVDWLSVPVVVLLTYEGCDPLPGPEDPQRGPARESLKDLQAKGVTLALARYDPKTGAVEWHDFDPDKDK